jgi:hypothetical protein
VTPFELSAGFVIGQSSEPSTPTAISTKLYAAFVYKQPARALRVI